MIFWSKIHYIIDVFFWFFAPHFSLFWGLKIKKKRGYYSVFLIKKSRFLGKKSSKYRWKSCKIFNENMADSIVVRIRPYFFSENYNGKSTKIWKKSGPILVVNWTTVKKKYQSKKKSSLKIILKSYRSFAPIISMEIFDFIRPYNIVQKNNFFVPL